MLTKKNLFQITFLTILVIFFGFISCEQLKGPVGPQGEQGLQGEKGLEGPAGPAYPIHNMGDINGTAWESDSEPYYCGFLFDTDGEWYNLDPEQDTYFYDILIEIDYDNPYQIRVTTGNNSETQLYKVNVNSLQDITSIPSESNRVNIVNFTTVDDPYFLVVKNKYNRWAKLCLMKMYSYHNFYGSGLEDHYYIKIYYEYYYYKDTEPDFTLHKDIG